MNPSPKFETVIVMGTYNGDQYLSEQVDSLIAQTEQRWLLLVKDDGSTDNTVNILKQYAIKDKRIVLLPDSDSFAGSALGNFALLLEQALQTGADFVFSCDQDDIWYPEKLSTMLAVLKQLEGADRCPALVHHDLEVVDRHLTVLHESFISMMEILPKDQQNPQRMVSRNEVTGCAMACNRSLLEIALPVPVTAVMHDWWLALFAAYFGNLEFEPKALVKYRQHDSNVIGAKSFFHGLNPFTNWLKGWRRGDQEFMETVEQAQAFRQATAERGLSISSEKVLDLYCGLPSASRMQRIKSLRECNLWRSHWLLNGMLVLRMLLLPRVTNR